MTEPIRDATLEEKIEYINSNLKPLYRGRYEKGLLIEALSMLIDVFGDDTTLNDADKKSKEFQIERRKEIEKELAHDVKMIEFFEGKLKPLQAAKESAPADKPTVTESTNGKVKEGEHI